jgi:hypothetical protein
VVLCRHAPAAMAAGAVGRYLLSTASYARRDLVSPLLSGRRPRPESVRRRLRAFWGFVRLLPHVVGERPGRGSRLGAAELRRWLQLGDTSG